MHSLEWSLYCDERIHVDDKIWSKSRVGYKDGPISTTIGQNVFDCVFIQHPSAGIAVSMFIDIRNGCLVFIVLWF